MTEYVNYKTAPIGTVAADRFTTLVKNDKGTGVGEVAWQ